MLLYTLGFVPRQEGLFVMPKVTLAQIENEIRASNPTATRSDIKKAAKLHLRRHRAHLYIPEHEEALLLVKAISYSDITGERACKNVMTGAAR